MRLSRPENCNKCGISSLFVFRSCHRCHMTPLRLTNPPTSTQPVTLLSAYSPCASPCTPHAVHSSHSRLQFDSTACFKLLRPGWAAHSPAERCTTSLVYASVSALVRSRTAWSRPGELALRYLGYYCTIRDSAGYISPCIDPWHLIPAPDLSPWRRRRTQARHRSVFVSVLSPHTHDGRCRNESKRGYPSAAVRQ